MHCAYAATCASIIVSDVGDLDGMYALDSSISHPYYFRAGGTTTYEVYQDDNAWFILDGHTSIGYRVSHESWCFALTFLAPWWRIFSSCSAARRRQARVSVTVTHVSVTLYDGTQGKLTFGSRLGEDRRKPFARPPSREVDLGDNINARRS